MTTFRVSQWAPANETESDLIAERLNLNGNILGGVGYGVHATLYFICLNLLLAQRRKHPKVSWTMIAYITLNFILGSIGNAANIKFNEMVFIDDRDFPGGPNAYFTAENSVTINVLAYAVYIVNTWTQDGLLLYRFFVIFECNYFLLIIPFCLYIVSIVMSCLLLAQIELPSVGFFASSSTNFALTYWSISIATTLLLTVLIVGRLLVMRYRLRKVLSTEGNSPYTSLSSMLIESAFLYAVTALIFIITFAKNDPVQNLVLPVLGQVQSISPLLITLRIAQGRAWTRDTFKTRGMESTMVIQTTIETEDSRLNTLAKLPNSKTYVGSTGSNVELKEYKDTSSV